MYRTTVVKTCPHCSVVKRYDICINCGYAPGIGYLPVESVRVAYGYDEEKSIEGKAERLC